MEAERTHGPCAKKGRRRQEEGRGNSRAGSESAGENSKCPGRLIPSVQGSADCTNRKHRPNILNRKILQQAKRRGETERASDLPGLKKGSRRGMNRPIMPR